MLTIAGGIVLGGLALLFLARFWPLLLGIMFAGGGLALAAALITYVTIIVRG